MKKKLIVLMVLFVGFSFAGCDRHGGHEGHDHDHGSADDHHDHDHDHESSDHDGHDDGAKGHDDHGERVELGEAKVGGFNVAVTVAGDLKAGHEIGLNVAVANGDVKPAVVRAWVGVTSAAGSMRSKLEKEGDGYHGHIEVPDPLPADSTVWVEIEDVEGKKVKGSFAIK